MAGFFSTNGNIHHPRTHQKSCFRVMKDLVLLLSLPFKHKNQSETTLLTLRPHQMATNRGVACCQYCNCEFIQTTAQYLGKLNCIFYPVDSQECSAWTGCWGNKPNDTISTNITARKKHTCSVQLVPANLGSEVCERMHKTQKSFVEG